MNLTTALENKIGRARAWLATQVVDGGGYCEWTEGGVPGPVTLLATGYAAHLFAWLFLITQDDCDRRAARSAAECIAGYLDGGLDDALFFELGIAARGMYAVSKALSRPDFWDASIVLGSMMKARLTAETDLGAHLRKPALIWKALKRQADFDDLDFMYFTPDYPEDGSKAKAGEQYEIGLSLRSLAYSCEALQVGEASQDRARRDFDVLRSLLKTRSHLRSDVLAQFIRLHLVMGNSLAMSDLDQLFDFQHESGGFHEVIATNPSKRTPSPRLSTVSTLFAVQAMAMAQSQDRCKLPGILTRRELAIV